MEVGDPAWIHLGLDGRGWAGEMDETKTMDSEAEEDKEA